MTKDEFIKKYIIHNANGDPAVDISAAEEAWKVLVDAGYAYEDHDEPMPIL